MPTSFAQLARLNANHFGGGANDLQVVIAIGDGDQEVRGSLGRAVGRNTLDAMGTLPPAQRSALSMTSFGLDIAKTRGWRYEHVEFASAVGPRTLAAVGLGAGYRSTDTDNEVLNACPFLAAFLTKVGMDQGEVPQPSILMQPVWQQAGLPWNPAWNSAQAVTLNFTPVQVLPANGVPGQRFILPDGTMWILGGMGWNQVDAFGNPFSKAAAPPPQPQQPPPFAPPPPPPPFLQQPTPLPVSAPPPAAGLPAWEQILSGVVGAVVAGAVGTPTAAAPAPSVEQLIEQLALSRLAALPNGTGPAWFTHWVGQMKNNPLERLLLTAVSGLLTGATQPQGK